jgi:leucyl aminopeptidase
MLNCFVARPTKTTISVDVVAKSDWKNFSPTLNKLAANWLKSTGFTGKSSGLALVPDRNGELKRGIFVVSDKDDVWSYAGLRARLPAGRFELKGLTTEAQANAAGLGWGLSAYKFTRYKKSKTKRRQLVMPPNADSAEVQRLVEGIGLTRDLINTPAQDMGPVALAAAAQELAEKHGAKCTITTGKKLLENNYPAIHAVGRAASEAPRLVDIRWGDKNAPKITLVGKGVTFDTGGLDMKSPAHMQLMKKDMGGGANVLGLAHAIMDAKLALNLRVLMPCVENSVAGNAFHPLDVLPTRKGITVEVGNTDAEGRLILCDALAEAQSEKPTAIFDFATLTGAARVAVGTELPAMFSNNEELAAELLAASSDSNEPIWRLPLHEEYRRHLDSRVADINNISKQPYGGAITAALFLREFVGKKTPWVHFDIMGFNLESRPGRPYGGEAMGVRAVYQLLKNRYSTTV